MFLPPSTECFLPYLVSGGLSRSGLIAVLYYTPPFGHSGRVPCGCLGDELYGSTDSVITTATPGAKDAPQAEDEGAVLEFKQYTRRDRSFY